MSQIPGTRKATPLEGQSYPCHIQPLLALAPEPSANQALRTKFAQRRFLKSASQGIYTHRLLHFSWLAEHTRSLRFMFIMQLVIFLQYKKEEIIPSGEFSGEIQCRVASSQPVVVWSQTISSLQIVRSRGEFEF